MKLPIIKGLIDRRILINYQVDAQVLADYLPDPFSPQLINEVGIAGICLIRLKHIRPKGLPSFIGISSENAAHRIAVEWEEKGQLRQGVYIPRRDTSSRLNAWAGGTIFPGTHYLSQFMVIENNGQYEVSFKNVDKTSMSIKVEDTDEWNSNSVFDTLHEASLFFEKGAVGYSPDKNYFDGLKLNVDNWSVSPLDVHHVASSFFENTDIFPKASIRFDNALLMKKLGHEWEALGQL